MNKMKVILMLALCGVTFLSEPAFASVKMKTTSCYAGSFGLWSNDHVQFTYSGKKVVWSNAWQTCGAAVPGITVKAKGIKKIYNTNWSKAYSGSYIGKSKVALPWGTVPLISRTKVCQTWVRGDGYWQAGYVR